jgi:hypothetical protein
VKNSTHFHNKILSKQKRREYLMKDIYQNLGANIILYGVPIKEEEGKNACHHDI